MTIEQQTAEAILQSAKETIEIGGQQWELGKPTVGTIIMASELISQLPKFKDEMTGKDIIPEVMRVAKDAKVIGKIVALLILGAKRVLEHRKRGKGGKIPWWRWLCDWLLHRKQVREEIDSLADLVLQELDSDRIFSIISNRLSNLQLGSFFGITTSLSQSNVLKATKDEVETGDEAEV